MIATRLARSPLRWNIWRRFRYSTLRWQGAKPSYHYSATRGDELLTLKNRFLVMAVLATAWIPAFAQQAAGTIDTSKLGPQVGAMVPAFEGVDQFDKARTLASTYGPQGTMLVFFRSADW